MNKVTELIVKTFESEQPDLCAAIKQAVVSGESRANFERFAKRVIGIQNTVTYPLCLTIFDFYKKNTKAMNLLLKLARLAAFALITILLFYLSL